ncbi:MAG: hypothetical protein IEMM0002_1166 [bacterium]|nr:MAG: hypothetical protein IEMM0002_1166 [bacterium]
MGVYLKIQIACPHCGKNVTKFCKHDGSLLNCPSYKASIKASIKFPPQKKRKGDG